MPHTTATRPNRRSDVCQNAHEPVYEATAGLMGTIDDLAAVLTGDRHYFHEKPSGVRHLAKALLLATLEGQRGQGAPMTDSKKSPTEARITWQVGQRVQRKNTNELGTVVSVDGQVKVKWDGGRTSYFRHAERANVQLEREW